MDKKILLGLEAWQRHRGMRPFDALLVLYGMAMNITLVVVFVAYKSGALSPAALAALAIFDAALVVYAFRRWREQPDFVTEQGTAVWVADMPVDLQHVLEVLTELAIKRFIKVVVCEQDLVTEAELRKMFSKTSVEWKPGLVSFIGSNYELRDKAGIQHGYRIMVQWAGSIAESALNHEFLHAVNQQIRLPKIKSREAREQFYLANMRHEESTWWILEGKICDTF